MRRIQVCCLLIALAAAIAIGASPASAEGVLAINCTNLKLKFDNGVIYDDPGYSLGSIEFFLDDDIDPIASLDVNVRADLLVQGVPNLPANTAVATSGGSFLSLLSNGETILSLSLGSMNVLYNSTGNGSISISGFANGILVSNLPDGVALSANDPIWMLLPAENLGGKHFTDGKLDQFTSTGGGTAEIIGQVPEPCALALWAAAAVALLAWRKFARR